MAERRLSGRLRAAARAFRDPGGRTASPSAPALATLERPITDVVASQAVFDVVDMRLQDAADAGRAPTNRELLAHAHASGEVARAVDRLALAYDKATGIGGAL